MKCNVCGFEFEPNQENHYIARDNGKYGFANLAGTEEKLFDAYDCPYCGCQIILQERKRMYEPISIALYEDKGEPPEGE